jgi:N-acetyl-anhydromuramyl-L-alanine amidase AmpD
LPTDPDNDYDTRRLSDITDLVIHHTVSPDDRTAAQIADYHVNSRGWPGIGYHYLISADGTIEQTNYLETVSYHAAGANNYSVGIALKGNFTDVWPTDVQLQATEWLVDNLQNDLIIDNVLGHKEVAGSATACPGATWLEWKGVI